MKKTNKKNICLEDCGCFGQTLASIASLLQLLWKILFGTNGTASESEWPRERCPSETPTECLVHPKLEHQKQRTANKRLNLCKKKKNTSNNKPMSEGLGKTLFEKRPNKLEALNSYLATRYHNSTEVTAGSQAPPAALQGLEGAKNFPISPLNLWPFELFLLLNDETAKPARLPPKNPLSNIKQHVIKKYQEISRMIHKIFHFHPTLASFCLNSSFSAAASA